jgi:hypothetical protein
MLRCAHADEEEEQQHVEKEQHQRGEEEGEQQRGEEEEAELERVPRQTQRRHVVAPPVAPAQEEDRVLIRLVGGK